MGSWIAYREKTNSVPNTPDSLEVLVAEIKQLSSQLNIADRLKAFRASAPRLERDPRGYHILDLNLATRKVRVVSYDELSRASVEFEELEKRYRLDRDKDVLLAAVYGANMRRAYPNYFADTAIFIGELSQALSNI